MTARPSVAAEPPPAATVNVLPYRGNGQQAAPPNVPPPQDRPDYVPPPAATVGVEPLAVPTPSRTGTGLQAPTFTAVDRILSFGVWTEIKKGSLQEATGTLHTVQGSVKPLLKFQLRSGGEGAILAEALHGWAPLATEDAPPSTPSIRSINDVTPDEIIGGDRSPFFPGRPPGRF